jgi:hypothetical protein
MANKRDLEDTVQPFRRAKHPRSQRVDEIRIRTVPRYKMSELSGNEWRESATVQLMYKGNVVSEDGYGDVAHAVEGLPQMLQNQDDYAPVEDLYCDQEGCADHATRTYKLKKTFDEHGEEQDPYVEDDTPLVRQFCDAHSTRGNQDFEDTDDNYEILKGGDPISPAEDTISKAQLVVIDNYSDLFETLTANISNQDA